MAEEAVQQATVEPAAQAATEQAQLATPAGAQNTDQQPAEHMIPKSRFDAINDELKQLKKLASDAERQRERAEAERLKEQGEYQKLFEKAQADLEAERTRARALELAGMRRDVAAKFQLPDGLAKRLQGETLEDLEKDAQDLLASIPKPAAPNINAGNAPTPGQSQNYLGGLTKQEFAARFGVRADLLG